MRLVEAITLRTVVGRTVAAEEGNGVRLVEVEATAPITVVGRKVIAFQSCGMTAFFVGAEEGVVGSSRGGESVCPGTGFWLFPDSVGNSPY